MYATDKLHQCYMRILVILDKLGKDVDALQRNVAV
jgi:hypothetical protein